jgi:CRP-like cAMP-binding protein
VERESSIQRVERSIFVRSLFGKRAAERVAERVAATMRDLYFPAGTVIYRRGEASENLYFIVEGEVTLELPGEPSWVMGPQDGFGFQDAMQDVAHARDARARSDTHVLAFAAEDWLDLLEDHADMGQGAILAQAESIRRAVSEVSPSGGFPEPGQCEPPADFEAPCGIVERIVILRDAPLFERAGIQALAGLARLAKPRAIRSGETLATAGTKSPGLVVVGAGVIGLERAQPELRARFGPGSIVGGLASVGTELLDWTVRAETDALALQIAQADWFDLMDDHFDLARSAFAYMAAERGLLMRALAVKNGS